MRRDSWFERPHTPGSAGRRTTKKTMAPGSAGGPKTQKAEASGSAGGLKTLKTKGIEKPVSSGAGFGGRVLPERLPHSGQYNSELLSGGLPVRTPHLQQLADERAESMTEAEKIPAGYKKMVRVRVDGEMKTSLLLFTPGLISEDILLADAAVDRACATLVIGNKGPGPIRLETGSVLGTVVPVDEVSKETELCGGGWGRFSGGCGCGLECEERPSR